MKGLGFGAILAIAVLTVSAPINADELIDSWSEKVGGVTVAAYLNSCTLFIEKKFGACKSPTSASSSTLRIPLSLINGVMISDVKGGAIIRIVYVSDNESRVEAIKRCDGELLPVVHPKDKDGYSVANVVLTSKRASKASEFDIMEYVELCH